MSKGTRQRSPTPASDSIDRIQRRLAVAFVGVVTLLMVVVLVAGSLMYVQLMTGERERLALLVGDTLKESIQGVRFSGKYRARLVVEELVRANEPLAYISIVGPDGKVIAHSDPAKNDGPADPDGWDAVKDTLGDGARRLQDRVVGGAHVSEIVLPLAGGYGEQTVGAIRVGLRTESKVHTLVRGAPGIAGLLLIVCLVGLPLGFLLARRLAAPVERQAKELSGILEHAPLVISIHDKEGRVLRCSGLFDELLGPAEHADSGSDGLRVQDVLPMSEALDDASRGTPRRQELTVPVGDEERLLFTTHFPVVTDSAGATLESCLIAADVTDLRRAALERDRLAAALESAEGPVVLVDEAGRVAYTNPAATRVTGFSAEEARELDPWRLIGSGDPAARQATEAQEAWAGRLTLERKDGSEVTCFQVLSPVQTADGRLRGFVALGRDVSREDALESKLRQAQKMEAVGRLAGGIAHDFNNLLVVINGRTELLQLKAAGNPALASGLAAVADAGRRATQLTGQLLAFSRQQDLERIELDLDGVVRAVIPMLRRVIGEDVELTYARRTALWPIMANGGQLEQILMNLVVNARDAMPGGGRIAISTYGVVLQAGDPDAAGGSPGQYVVLSVEDGGSGMSAEVRQQVFDPFFTTKAVGKGTGLGLATVHGIVEQHGGFIALDTAPGRGTTFRIHLPRHAAHDADGAEGTGGDVPVGPPGGHETILVVEDEESVRQVVASMLKEVGYTTLEASTGEEALSKLWELPQPPDLVLSDLVMPKMNGRELAMVLRERYPRLKMMFISGYSDSVIREGGDLGNSELLQKPADMRTLCEAVRRTLDG